MSERVTVWVAPVQTLEGEPTFPWVGAASDPSLWQVEPRLVPEVSASTDRAQGSARFRLLRDAFVERGAPVAAAQPLVPGAWIAICHGEPGEALDVAQVRWWGYIADRSREPIPGAEDGPGQVVAHRPGRLLADSQATGWAWQDDDPEGSYGVPMNRPPTANVASDDGQIMGNGVGITDENLSESLAAQMVFARSPSALSPDPERIWTRWRLLRHIAGYVIPAAGGRPRPPVLASEAVVARLDDASAPEVYPLADQTLDGLLQLCCPEWMGVSWDLDLADDGGSLGWVIRLIQTDAEGQPLTVPESALVSVSESVDHLYDAVTVRGAPIIVAGTVGPADSNLLAGWADGALAEYLQPAAGGSDDELRARRALPDLEAVGRRFRVQGQVNDYELRTQDEPITGEVDLSTGSGYGSGVIPLVPLVRRRPGTTTPLGDEEPAYDLDGDQVTGIFVADSISRTPYLPTARMQADLPIPLGWLPDDDQRSDDQVARPEYLPPRLLAYDGAAWTDLLSPEADQIPQVSAAGAGLVVQVRYSRQEYLLAAAESWDGVLFPEIDWEHLALTLALESDQYLERQILRAEGIAVRRELVIRRPDLALWLVRRGSILGLGADGEPIRAPHDLATRDDSATVDALAERLAADAFRPRRQVEITVPAYDATAWWLVPGAVISQLIDAGTTRPVASMVRTVTRQYAGRPGTSMSTEIAATPRTAAPAMAASPATVVDRALTGPSRSTPISPELRQTPTQATAAIAADQRERSRDERRRILIPASAPTESTDLRPIIRVEGGNELPPSDGPGVLRAAAVIDDIRLSTGPDVYPDPGRRALTGAITRSAGVLTAVAAAALTDNQGSNYKALGDMSTPEKRCTVAGGGGSGAIVEIASVSGGRVTGFTVVDGGTGYDTSPVVTPPYPTGIPAGLPWPDGIGYGNRWLPTTGNAPGERVLIVHDPRSQVQHAVVARQTYLAGQTVLIQGRTLYMPWWL